jgi:hypothetical protein
MDLYAVYIGWGLDCVGIYSTLEVAEVEARSHRGVVYRHSLDERGPGSRVVSFMGDD